MVFHSVYLLGADLKIHQISKKLIQWFKTESNIVKKKN
jgi:hypothetical protein